MADVVAGQASPDPNVYVPPEAAPTDSPIWQALGFGPPVTPSPSNPGADRPLNQAPGSGQGYQYTRDQLHDLAKNWNDLANKYADDKASAQFLVQVQPPGLEYASQGNIEMIQKSAVALCSTLDQRETYCRDMAKKCVEALGSYASAEELAGYGIDQKSEGIL